MSGSVYLPGFKTMGAIVRVGIAAICIIMAGAATWAGYTFYHRLTPFERTDDAYVRGDITWITPRVAGYVIALNADENEPVKPLQPLVQIDPRDFRATYDERLAAVSQAEAAMAKNRADASLLDADIRVARADIDASRAQLKRAEADFARAEALRDRGAATEQALDQRRADLVANRSRLLQAQARLDAEETRRLVIEAARLTVEADLKAARAAAFAARIRLEDTSVWTPIAGRVAARSVRVGEYVNVGARMLAVVPTDGLWLNANFRETQIGRMAPGDRVAMRIDALPALRLCGTVESLSSASGADFALIPADNATGNFTKVVRRFPVRIRFDAGQKAMEQVRVGMSVVPTVAIGSHRDGKGGLGFDCETNGPVKVPEPLRRILPADIAGQTQ